MVGRFNEKSESRMTEACISGRETQILSRVWPRNLIRFISLDDLIDDSQCFILTMTSLDPSHLPEFGWKPQPRTRGEAVLESPYSSSLPIRALPDLRFEQSYLLSLKPFVHIRADEVPAGKKSAGRGTVEKPAVEETALAEPIRFDIATQSAGVSKYGTPERIEWGKIVWVTLRDQVSRHNSNQI